VDVEPFVEAVRETSPRVRVVQLPMGRAVELSLAGVVG